MGEVHFKKIIYFPHLFILFSFIFIWGTGCGDDPSHKSCDAAISASGYLASKDCRLLSWGANIPIIISKEDSLPIEISTAINQAVNIWEAATGVDLFEIRPSVIRFQDELNHQFNLVGVRGGENWLNYPIEGKEGEPAKTVYFYRDELYNANIFFNEAFVNGSKGKYDFVSIALHELGHVLGLDHDDTDTPTKSIMNSKIKPGEKLQLTEKDIRRVQALYLSF